MQLHLLLYLLRSKFSAGKSKHADVKSDSGRRWTTPPPLSPATARVAAKANRRVVLMKGGVIAPAPALQRGLVRRGYNEADQMPARSRPNAFVRPFSLWRPVCNLGTDLKLGAAGLVHEALPRNLSALRKCIWGKEEERGTWEQTEGGEESSASAHGNRASNAQTLGGVHLPGSIAGTFSL